ncbi:MAG TPA: phosphate acyltransferase, partial [Inquilinus sp.]
RDQLSRFVFRSGFLMKPLFQQAKADPKRVIYAEGEDERVLRAVQIVFDDQLAKPILIGRRGVVERRIEKLGLRLKLDCDVELVDPESDPRYTEYWRLYHQLLARRGVSPDVARTVVRTNSTVIAALMVQKQEADAMVCGSYGPYRPHLRDVLSVIGLAPGVTTPAALSALVLPRGTFFLADTYITPDPTPEQIAETTLLAAEEVRRLGIVPKVALLSHSNFGTMDGPSPVKMRHALSLIREQAPALEVEGEMHADAALSEEVRQRIFPDSKLTGSANLLVLPSLDAANIAFNMLKVLGEAISIGPMLLGVARPAHIVTPSVTVRGLVNITAIATVDAQLAGAVCPIDTHARQASHVALEALSV